MIQSKRNRGMRAEPLVGVVGVILPYEPRRLEERSPPNIYFFVFFCNYFDDFFLHTLHMISRKYNFLKKKIVDIFYFLSKTFFYQNFFSFS